jgi:hypothetical protein
MVPRCKERFFQRKRPVECGASGTQENGFFFLFASSLKDALLSVSKQINAQTLELGTRESRLLI